MLNEVWFCCLFVFFFQAEDGIRDGTVTGVQTCALPISHSFVGEVLANPFPGCFQFQCIHLQPITTSAATLARVFKSQSIVVYAALASGQKHSLSLMLLRSLSATALNQMRGKSYPWSRRFPMDWALTQQVQTSPFQLI